MRLSRRGIVSLPVKLAVSFMIIALMVPPMAAMVDQVQEQVDVQELTLVADGLADAVNRTYTKGPAYVTHYEVSIPDGCRLAIGGDDPMAIRLYIGDERVGRVIIGVPVQTGDTWLYGDAVLELSNTVDGTQKVAVREL